MTTIISLSITFFYILFFLFLIIVDLMVNIFLFIYAMAFQFSVYGIYLGLFIVCHATGNLHKLEKTEVNPPTKRLKKKTKKIDVGRFKVEVVRGEDESGYLTDLDDLNITDVGENVE